jgi:transposase
MLVDLSDDGFVSETIGVATSGPAKRVLRTADEKRRIVEATLVPGASIARVARENGVNANQVFQWRYEHRNGTGWAAVGQPRTQLLPVTGLRLNQTPTPSVTVLCVKRSAGAASNTRP